MNLPSVARRMFRVGGPRTGSASPVVWVPQVRVRPTVPEARAQRTVIELILDGARNPGERHSIPAMLALLRHAVEAGQQVA